MIKQICQKAKAASVEMAKLTAEAKNNALCRMAIALEANAEKILTANQVDVEAAKTKASKHRYLTAWHLIRKKFKLWLTNSEKSQSYPTQLAPFLVAGPTLTA